MQIECPKCHKENNIKLNAIVRCGHCQEELSSHKFKKHIISSGAMLAVGIVGGQIADYVINDNRYPIKTEYSIIDACNNSYSELVSLSVYSRRKEICLCSMEKTMNEISYIRYKVDHESFASAFSKNSEICSEPNG